MKVIQNVAASVQQFHDAWLDLMQEDSKEKKFSRGLKFIQDDILWEVLACSKHHIQVVSTYPEGEKYIDLQLDSLNPTTTIVEINECFESKQVKIQFLAWGYELFYQLKFKQLTKEKIKNIEKMITNENTIEKNDDKN